MYVYIYYLDHTSQDHFCSMLDKFPVWNLEPDFAMMMSCLACPEREEVLLSIPGVDMQNVDDRFAGHFWSARG